MDPSIKEEILSRLREENSAQLEEHKRQLEGEYQRRLETFMGQFKPHPSSGASPHSTESGSGASKARVTARVEDSASAARHVVKLGGQKGALIVVTREMADTVTASAAAEEGRGIAKKVKQVAEMLSERTVKTYITTPSKQEELGADPLRNKSQALSLTGDWLSPVHALPSKQTGVAPSPSSLGSSSKAKGKPKQAATPVAKGALLAGVQSPLDMAARIVKNDFTIGEQEQLLDSKMNNITKYLLHKTEFLLKGVADDTSLQTRKKTRRPGRDIEDVIYDSLMKDEAAAAGGGLPEVALHSPLSSVRSPDTSTSARGEQQSERLPRLGSERRRERATAKDDMKEQQEQQEQQQQRQQQDEQEHQPPRPPRHLHPAVKYANPLVDGGHYSKVNDVPHEALDNTMPAHAWQNDIARHILSVFASQKTKDTNQPQHKVMQYVDTNRKENLLSVKEHLAEEGADIHKIVAEFDATSLASSPTYSHGADDAATVSTHSTRVSAKSKASLASAHQLSDAEAAQKYITDMAKASKFRKTQMVRAPYVETPSDEPTTGALRWRSKHLRRGVDIALRSSPNVVPIWFVSTGELDSNWSVLPGGQALQAQLHVMYENKGFMEYLCVLERSILQLWAEATEPPTLKQTSQAREKGRTSPPHAKTRARESDRSRNKDEGGDDDDASHLLTSADDMWDYEIGKPVDVFAARSGPGKALSRAFSADEVSQLWKKFIVTANAMVLLCCEGKLFDKAIDLLTRLEEWSSREAMLPPSFRAEVRAYLFDSFSYFFYRKKKNRSALNYSLKSLAIYERANNVEYISVVLLHICCVHVQNRDYKEAHRVVQEFLVMISDGRLSSTDTTPKMLCLASIGYHNLAVVQLKMDVPDLAAKSSQSARKIAKLCLSYSNRWLATFERTHECAVEEIKFQMAANHGLKHRVIKVSDPLITELYSHNIDLAEYHDSSEK